MLVYMTTPTKYVRVLRWSSEVLLHHRFTIRPEEAVTSSIGQDGIQCNLAIREA